MPIQKKIVFESVPDLSDSPKAVFDEMIKRGIHKRYTLIWLLHNPVKGGYKKIPHVRYVPMDSARSLYHQRTAKCLVSCNGFLESRRHGQTSVYIAHGTTIKSVGGYYRFPRDLDYCVIPAQGVAHLYEQDFEVPAHKIVPLGYPRNDALTNQRVDLHPLFPDVDFDKVAVWYPTYRQSKNKLVVTEGNSLPIIHDKEKAVALNAYAKEQRVLLVLKPHFAQDIGYVSELQLSHIRFIDDAFFERHAISSYAFVGSCDALISDYSSIYYDYTLCDKPIALIWEDVEQYKQYPGLAEAALPYLVGGEKIYTLDELQQFIGRLAGGEDVLKAERNRICGLVNCSTDGKNTDRVTDFILQKIGE